MNRPTKASLDEIPELDTRNAKLLRRGPRPGRPPLRLSLGEMRKAANKTQEDVARTLEIDQAEISRLEHRDDVLLSTLRRYARALGAECEVAFVFPKTGHRGMLVLAGDEANGMRASSATIDPIARSDRKVTRAASARRKT